jgi:hypothetical protein
VLHSTLERSCAYGRPGIPSAYTEVLLKAVRGAGGNAAEGEYWIETTSLQTALHHLIGMSLPSKLQVPETLRSATFKVDRPDDVEIPTFVTCTDPAATGGAMLYCDLNGNKIHTVQWNPRRGSFWEIALKPDKYKFGANPPSGLRPKDVMVYAPVIVVKLQVEPRRRCRSRCTWQI